MTTRTAVRLTLVAATCALAGCRGGGSSVGTTGGDAGTGGALASRGDPLFGARIPPQNLPVPGRDSYGSRERRDPLLGLPKTERDERAAGKDDKKGSASLAPKGTKEPFRNGVATTPAALAGHLPTDDSTLSIGDRRPAVIPASATREIDGALDRHLAELKKLGAKVGQPEPENGKYVIRCEVPIDADDPGRLRWYEGGGPTPAAAAKQLLDQVRGDRK